MATKFGKAMQSEPDEETVLNATGWNNPISRWYTKYMGSLPETQPGNRWTPLGQALMNRVSGYGSALKQSWKDAGAQNEPLLAQEDEEQNPAGPRIQTGIPDRQRAIGDVKTNVLTRLFEALTQGRRFGKIGQNRALNDPTVDEELMARDTNPGAGGRPAFSE